ncbi:uncharacterized protein LOC111021675 [Momordica charantia]|uniref:Uncharacterized protein LOC111021675 n=1 Tax=Momordica charantia TaxID=3673 RepID=A0A6J1DM27_MOMCH|nr:uncharacterized protein LOC111021675 [Momordica charantia]
MGACLSCSPASVPPPPATPTAKVISLEGNLREYPAPISVSRVLQTENPSSSTSDSFLCNSDSLYYDDFIPPMPLDDQLLASQIYFLLPSSKLRQRLSASDMAAMALKASLALQNASSKDPLLRKKGRISPLLIPNPTSDSHSDSDSNLAPSDSKKNNGVPVPIPIPIPESSSVRKLQKLTSRRAKMAVRSFKLKLSTIYEGTVL